MPKDPKGKEIVVGSTVKVTGEFTVKSIGDGERLLLTRAEGELTHEVECDACCVKVCPKPHPHK